jgi:hypothetical protein
MANSMDQREGRKFVEQIARDTLAALQADAKSEYNELVKAYEGCSAVLGIFGMGSATIAVSRGEVQINPTGNEVGTRQIMRGATFPETIVAMSTGDVTPLEAFHASDLVVRAADSRELHKAYEFVVKFSAVPLKSERMQKVIADIKARTGQT